MGGPGSGRKPRDYPPEVIALVCGLYRDGLSVAEIRARAPKGYRVQTILERYMPARRPAVPRDQTGVRNPGWRGASAGYQALHLRVETARGRPSLCDWCGATEGRFEWANLTGAYEDTADYARLCLSCHRRFDAARRRATGRRTSPAKGVMPRVR